MTDMNYELKKQLVGISKQIEKYEEDIAELREYEQKIKKVMKTGIDLNTPIYLVEDFPYSRQWRLVNEYYWENDVRTIGQVIEMEDEELLRVPGFGKRSLKKFHEWIKRNGLEQLV